MCPPNLNNHFKHFERWLKGVVALVGAMPSNHINKFSAPRRVASYEGGAEKKKIHGKE